MSVHLTGTTMDAKQKETEAGNLGTIAQRLNPLQHQPYKLENWQRGRAKVEGRRRNAESERKRSTGALLSLTQANASQPKKQSHMLHERPGGQRRFKVVPLFVWVLSPGSLHGKRGAIPN